MKTESGWVGFIKRRYYGLNCCPSLFFDGLRYYIALVGNNSVMSFHQLCNCVCICVHNGGNSSAHYSETEKGAIYDNTVKTFAKLQLKECTR